MADDVILNKEISETQPRQRIFVGPFVSTDQQLDAKFTTYVQEEIFRSMYRAFARRQFVTPFDLYWPLDRYGMKLSDINSIDRARELALETKADSLRDLSSDTEIASKETKLYKDVALRALLEGDTKPITR